MRSPSRADSDRGQSLRADAMANRRALLEAAAELYAERGLDVSYEEIARRAGVGRATLYRHFSTRDELLAGILDGIVDELAAIADQLPPEPTSFFKLFDAAAELQGRNLPLTELLRSAFQTSERVTGVRERIELLFAERLSAAQAAGLAREELSASDARIALTMLSGLAQRTSTSRDRRRARELARLMLSVG